VLLCRDNRSTHEARWQIAEEHHCSSPAAAACQTTSTYPRFTLDNRSTHEARWKIAEGLHCSSPAVAARQTTCTYDTPYSE
jgi:hypothetical protein